MTEPPPQWGLNTLTASFDAARENQFATFYRKPEAKDLVAIDRVLWGLLEGHVDPSPVLPLNFLLRAHSCFRAAAECAMSGQVYEAMALARAALEAAAYGLFIDNDDQRAKLWFSRSDSNSAKERVRTTFGFGNLKRDLEKRHPAVAQVFTQLYDNLIDFGAHPNEGGFAINMSVRDEPKSKIFDTVYLHGEGLPLDFGLKNVARVGLWVILAFLELYPQAYQARGFSEIVNEMLGRH